eukprot:scaffold317802_cov18-Tisochrysis_lutea.AAC.1
MNTFQALSAASSHSVCALLCTYVSIRASPAHDASKAGVCRLHLACPGFPLPNSLAPFIP